MPNMIGAAVQAIDSYCKIRAKINPQDLCALFGFNRVAFDIFENISVLDQDIILKNCFEKLKPQGFTLFKKAFEKAYNLISNKNFDKEHFIPVIILLTDGLDHDEDTIKYIKEKVNHFL